jgi:biliverdin reductase / flavin reductase
MRVLVFGASGRTGRELLLALLARGHDVTAVVRRPDRFGLSYDRLRVTEGDVLQPQGFEAALAGQDAVLSALGVTGFLNSLRPMLFYQRSAQAMIEAMGRHGVRRLVVVSSVGVLDDPSAPFWYRTTVKPLLRHKYRDMTRMEREIAASALDWTVVRAARLVPGPLTQRYRIGRDGTLPDVTRISRADLADFVAAQASDRTLAGHAVAISY